jgi:hypothetical protein
VVWLLKHRLFKRTKCTDVLVIFLVVSLLLIVQYPVLAQQSEWSKTYSDSQGQGNCVIAVDGGYVIAGVSNKHFLLAKTDSNGEVIWWKTFQSGEATSVIQTIDGGYALAGSGEVNLIKTDSSGNVQWSKNIAYGSQTYKINSLCLTDDEGLFLTGYTPATNSPQHDLTVRVESTKGAIVWANTYGTQAGQSFGTNVINIADGFVLAANQKLYRLNLEGKVLWSKPANVANSLVWTRDGGYLLVSGTGSMLTKFDSEGNTEWSKVYELGSPQKLHPAYQFFNSAVESRDGGFVAAGMAFPTPEGVAWIVKTDSNGNEQWNTTANSFTGHNSKANSIIRIVNDIYVFTGDISSISSPNYSEVWLAKFSDSILPASNANINQNLVSSSPDQTSSQTPSDTAADVTPSVPEFSLLTILPILLATPIALAIVRKKLQRNV